MYPIVWQAVKFRGSALLSTRRPQQNNALLATITTNPFVIMPRNKVSNDLDHVRKDPKAAQVPKGRPPDS